MSVEYTEYIEALGETDGDFMHSALFSPLIVEDEVIGVFSIQAEKKNSYTESDEVLLNTLASYLAIAFNALIFIS